MPPSQIQLNWPLQKPQQLLYVELGQDNGGMVLGICEHGFSFRAVGPVLVQGPLEFGFALDGTTRMSGSGELAWSEDNGKSGGLKFTNVSPEFRDALRAWLTNNSSPKSVGREVTPAAALPLDALEKQRFSPKPMDTVDAKASDPADQPARPFLGERTDEPSAKPSAPTTPVEKVVVENPRSTAPEMQAVQTPPPLAPALPPHTETATRELAEPQPAAPTQPSPVPASPPEASTPVYSEPAEAAVVSAAPSAKPVPATPPESLRAELKSSHSAKPAESPAVPMAPPPQEPELRTAAPLPVSSHQSGSGFSLPKFKLPSATVAPDLPEKMMPPAPVAPAEIIAVTPHTEARLQKTSNIEPVQPNVTDHTATVVASSPIPEPPLVPGADDPTRLIPPPIHEAFTDHEHEMPVSWETEPTPESPRMNRAAAGVIIGLAFAILVMALAISFRRELGQALIHFGESISGEEQKPAAPPQPTSSINPAQNSAGGVSLEKSPAISQSASDASKETNATRTDSSRPADQNSPDEDSSTPAGTGSGQKEFEQARTILKGNHRQRDLQDAVDLLSTAADKGYVPALVTLADLYWRGDGVAKNCSEARSLLETAVQKGSPEGRKRLSQLKRQGCS